MRVRMEQLQINIGIDANNGWPLEIVAGKIFALQPGLAVIVDSADVGIPECSRRKFVPGSYTI